MLRAIQRILSIRYGIDAPFLEGSYDRSRQSFNVIEKWKIHNIDGVKVRDQNQAKAFANSSGQTDWRPGYDRLWWVLIG